MNAKYLRIFLVLAIVALAGTKAKEHKNDLLVFYHRHFKDPRTVEKYFAEHKERKLHLGAGGHVIPGWLNSDIDMEKDVIYLDATERFPFDDGAFHYVYSEHLIEHLPWEGGLKMLQETYRVLAPGGKMRLITPNLEKHYYALMNPQDKDVQAYLAANQRLWKWPDTPVLAAYDFNRNMREWGHQFIYDRATLRKTLELAGFKEIKELELEAPTDPAFQNIAARTREYGADVWLTNSFYSMVFEAAR